MGEYFEGSIVLINNTNIEKLTDKFAIEQTENKETYFINTIRDEDLQNSLSSKSNKIFKFILNSKNKIDDLSNSDILNDRYVWVGLIKQRDCLNLNENQLKIQDLNYHQKYELQEQDVDYLLDKWNEQYINSDYIINKNQSIKVHFLNSIGRFENYKDHFVFIKNNKIVANLSAKYFYYPLANAECSAIHMWIDQKELNKDEKIYIHNRFGKEIDKINNISQMFCGISIQNTKALKASYKYGFTPYFIESKKYK